LSAPRSTNEQRSISPEIPAIWGSITRTMIKNYQKCL
jgi:hypothetical protein